MTTKIFNMPLNLVTALAIICISTDALIFAYVAEYIFNYKPCILCLYQRVPYFLTTLLGVIALIYHGRKNPDMAVRMFYICGVIFFGGAVLAGFHTGVEQGWWEGTKACGGGALPTNASIDELKAYLTNQPIVRCDVPTWKFLGLSMTNYNFVLSLILAVGTFIMAGKGSKNGAQ